MKFIWCKVYCIGVKVSLSEIARVEKSLHGAKRSNVLKPIAHGMKRVVKKRSGVFLLFMPHHTD